MSNPRIIANEKAKELIATLKKDHGDLMFHQSGGCCDGSQPMCFQKGEFYLKNLIISESYAELKLCQLVIECTIENEEIKRSVYGKIEAEIADHALLTSNTSAIPISELQKLTQKPDRFFGLHCSRIYPEQ